MTATQVCMSIMTLEDELVEGIETITITATGVSGVLLSGSPATLEVHSRESELVLLLYFLWKNF